MFGLDQLMARVSELTQNVLPVVEAGQNTLRTVVDKALWEALVAAVSARSDTPVTKLTLMDEGKEIVMELDRKGEVEKVLVDGKPAPASDYGKYKQMASRTFRTYLGQNDPVPPVPPAPPAPPAPAYRGSAPPSPPSIPNLSGMPTPPRIGKIPALPSPPSRGNMSDAQFEKAMEKYEATMEEWGEQLEKQFEGQDWKKYEEAMKEWGESLKVNLEGQDWEKFGQDMEKWGEQFAEQFNDQNWEEFGQRMEEWGEEFARTMEDRVAAEIEADELHADAARVKAGVDRLAHELVSEGLIDQGDAYQVRINEDELYVNGERQSASLHRKLKDLIEDDLDLEVADEWVEINKKKGTAKIKDQN
jgi:hypothetical protein